jgi:hypothetical protein
MADFSLSLKSELPVSVAAFVLGLAAAIGCQRSQPAGTSEVQPTYNRDTGRLERISYDRNRDTRMDAWLVMDGTRVVRAELDENFDGAVDRWEYYGGQAVPAAAGSGDGLLPRARCCAPSKPHVVTGKSIAGNPTRTGSWRRSMKTRTATARRTSGRPGLAAR